MNEINPLVSDGTYVEAPFPSFKDDSGNSLGCLNYWMYKSAIDPNNCGKGHWNPAQWSINGGQGLCHP